MYSLKLFQICIYKHKHEDRGLGAVTKTFLERPLWYEEKALKYLLSALDCQMHSGVNKFMLRLSCISGQESFCFSSGKFSNSTNFKGHLLTNSSITNSDNINLINFMILVSCVCNAISL